MTHKTKIPLAVGKLAAERLVAVLAPACEQLLIAGSIRRGAAMVGDIEIVAIPKLYLSHAIHGGTVLDDLLEGLIIEGKLRRDPPPGKRPAWGERYKKAWLQVKIKGTPVLLQLDLFLATADNWGAIATIRTGPSGFSQALVTWIRDVTPYRQHKGFLIDQETGEVIPVRTERDYFDRAGLVWVEPADRKGPWNVKGKGS